MKGQVKLVRKCGGDRRQRKTTYWESAPWAFNDQFLPSLVSISSSPHSDKPPPTHIRYPSASPEPKSTPPSWCYSMAQFHRAAKHKKYSRAKHNRIVLITRIRLPAKIPCHMYNLWLLVSCFQISRTFLSNIFCPQKIISPISPWAYDFGERKTLAILWNKHKCRNKDSFDEKWLKDPSQSMFLHVTKSARYNAVIGRYNAVHRNFGLKTL